MEWGYRQGRVQVPGVWQRRLATKPKAAATSRKGAEPSTCEATPTPPHSLRDMWIPPLFASRTLWWSVHSQRTGLLEKGRRKTEGEDSRRRCATHCRNLQSNHKLKYQEIFSFTYNKRKKKTSYSFALLRNVKFMIRTVSSAVKCRHFEQDSCIKVSLYIKVYYSSYTF